MNEAIVKNRKLHLDPRTKILILAAIATLEMINVSIEFTIAVGIVPFVLYFADGRISGAIKYAFMFGLAVAAHFLRSDLQINMVLNMVIVLLGGFVLKLFPAFACGEYFLKSTSVSEAMAAFSAMRIGRKMLIPLSVMFRFFPTINRERAAIHDAAAMRGITIGRKRFWKNPGQAFEYRVIPLMISVANIGNDLSAAALSRGLDNPVRHTTYTDVKIGRTDIIAVFAITFFLVTVAVCSTIL
ncbi:MAG: energy-coupling factor transporter transmembrane protein EcfT [Lachnospiraceae bacterium]|nr:energy-coupling factor transporter transmembrane protein EcfT [Lachnospiraceae bacterium]